MSAYSTSLLQYQRWFWNLQGTPIGSLVAAPRAGERHCHEFRSRRFSAYHGQISCFLQQRYLRFRFTACTVSGSCTYACSRRIPEPRKLPSHLLLLMHCKAVRKDVLLHLLARDLPAPIRFATFWFDQTLESSHGEGKFSTQHYRRHPRTQQSCFLPSSAPGPVTYWKNLFVSSAVTAARPTISAAATM
jgi:hypothetical protein